MFRLVFVIPLFVFAGQLQAEVLLRMEVQQGVAVNTVDLKLFEKDAPNTVANFLDYVNGTTVNGGSYDNSFIHRSADAFIDGVNRDFVIQGGGYTFDPTLNDGSFSYDTVNEEYNGGLQEVTTDSPIRNEFKRSNLRGTIAMAKRSLDPHSATSQWFINVGDNSSILDEQNEGFTVFGEVLADGMTVVDQIAKLTTYRRNDIHSAFA